jgi:hypothetical protein
MTGLRREESYSIDEAAIQVACHPNFRNMLHTGRPSEGMPMFSLDELHKY